MPKMGGSMIKLPKEISKIMRKIEAKEFQVYVVGGSVRDSLLGEQPIDWDLATDARLEELTLIFPEAEVLSENLSVIRIDYTSEENEEGYIVDIATFRVEGEYVNYKKPNSVEFTKSIEEDLKRRDFTINAIADNPDKPIVDPYNGRGDITAKLIRTVGDATERFQEDPARMLRAVRFAAELGFDLHKDTYEAIIENSHLLEKISINRIRSEFEKIIVAKNVGKGIRMLLGTNLLSYIIGEKLATKMTSREVDLYNTYCDNVYKTQPICDRRLGLFYMCFEKNRALQAIDKLEFDSKTKQHLVDVHYLFERLWFMANKHELKEFLVTYGPERYEYLHNLAKAQRITYDLTEVKIMNRHYMMKDIIDNNEPIYVEDLAIDGNDLIEAGIAEGEKIGKILTMLTDVVHRKPSQNTREVLLEKAKQFSKNKAAATFRRVKWLK